MSYNPVFHLADPKLVRDSYRVEESLKRWNQLGFDSYLCEKAGEKKNGLFGEELKGLGIFDAASFSVSYSGYKKVKLTWT